MIGEVVVIGPLLNAVCRPVAKKKRSTMQKEEKIPPLMRSLRSLMRSLRFLMRSFFSFLAESSCIESLQLASTNPPPKKVQKLS